MKKMNRQHVFEWLKVQKGHVTIEQLVHKFSGIADPAAIAEGFSMYVQSKVDVR